MRLQRYCIPGMVAGQVVQWHLAGSAYLGRPHHLDLQGEKDHIINPKKCFLETLQLLTNEQATLANPKRKKNVESSWPYDRLR